jgi:hypothetical protein
MGCDARVRKATSAGISGRWLVGEINGDAPYAVVWDSDIMWLEGSDVVAASG